MAGILFPLCSTFDPFPPLPPHLLGLVPWFREAAAPVSASWRAVHSGCRRRSRRSCSTSRRRAGLEPPSRSCDVCRGSFHLRNRAWRGFGCRIHPQTSAENIMISCTHTHTGRYLRLAGRRGGCCTVAPGRAWRRRRSLGCAFCPPSDTVPPSFAGPFRRSASTARAKRQQPDFEPKPHEICIVVKKLTAFPSLCAAAGGLLTALHSVVNHCG